MTQASMSPPVVQIARPVGTAPRRFPVWIPVCAVLLVLCLFLTGLYQLVGYRNFFIPSAAMEPTLLGPGGTSGQEGDRVRVDVLFAPMKAPRRGEIWVFRAPKQASPQEKEFIKRVVGEPGDTVEVVPPALLVDGKRALKLSPNESSVRLAMTEKGGRPDVQGSVAHLTAGYSELSFKVLAAPGARIEVSPQRVVVNGKAELVDQDGTILEMPQGLGPYGPEAGVQGRVFHHRPGRIQPGSAPGPAHPWPYARVRSWACSHQWQTARGAVH